MSCNQAWKNLHSSSSGAIPEVEGLWVLKVLLMIATVGVVGRGLYGLVMAQGRVGGGDGT